MKIPKLENGHVSVLSVEPSTGHVLTKNGDLFLNDSNLDPFWKFESELIANEFIQVQLKENPNREYTIFNHKQKLVSIQNSHDN